MRFMRTSAPQFTAPPGDLSPRPHGLAQLLALLSPRRRPPAHAGNAQHLARDVELTKALRVRRHAAPQLAHGCRARRRARVLVRALAQVAPKCCGEGAEGAQGGASSRRRSGNNQRRQPGTHSSFLAPCQAAPHERPGGRIANGRLTSSLRGLLQMRARQDAGGRARKTRARGTLKQRALESNCAGVAAVWAWPHVRTSPHRTPYPAQIPRRTAPRAAP